MKSSYNKDSRFLDCLHSRQELHLLLYRISIQDQIQNSGYTMDSWDYEECLDLIDYVPEKNNFFDIWQYEVGFILIHSYWD